MREIEDELLLLELSDDDEEVALETETRPVAFIRSSTGAAADELGPRFAFAAVFCDLAERVSIRTCGE